MPLVVSRDTGAPAAGFTLLAQERTGVSFTNSLVGDAALTNAVANNGSGVAVGDINGDGLPDLFFCRLQGANELFLNRGRWQFTRTDPGPAACPDQYSTGAALVDIDGDGDNDLLVNGIASGTRLFLNNGTGTLAEKADSGLSRSSSPMSLALADIDGDGDLDLYCAQYIDVMYLADPTTQLTFGTVSGQRVVTQVNGQSAALPPWRDRFELKASGEVRERPEADALYRNEGGGRFTSIEATPGRFRDESGRPIPPPRDWGLGAMFRDLNHDRAPDLFVCNDNASPDRLWINSGDGQFHAVEARALRHGSRSSMGVDFADINRDGQDDFIVLDMFARQHDRRMRHPARLPAEGAARMQLEPRPLFNRNTLFLGRRDGTFLEAAFASGIAATDWSWCPVFLDVDLDGWEDLLVTTGFDHDVLDQDSTDGIQRQKWSPQQARRYRRVYPEYRSPNEAYRNRKDGTFEPVGSLWGFDTPGVSQGMALGDLDGDGDLDVVVNNLNAPAGLYRNEGTADRIAVELQGLPPNTAGIGARIRVLGGAVDQEQEVIGGGRYLSGDAPMRVFAGKAAPGKSLRLEVEWRSGRRSRLDTLEPNRRYRIAESDAAPPETPPTRTPERPLFSDVSSRLDRIHQESEFPDWGRQPALPYRLSRLGPSLCWYDFNSDGWEDLIIAGARGGKLGVFANTDGREFNLLEGEALAFGDQSSIVGWANGTGQRNFLVAISNFETPGTQPSELTVFSPVAPPQTLVAGPASTGALAVADIDGDGDLDVFSAGRQWPGQYPRAASSLIWRNERGTLVQDPGLSREFQDVGLVTGAAFCDVDGNGTPDLVLATEWGPIRLFLNENAGFRDATAAWGLNGNRGIWLSLAVGDFDGDGRCDLVAGNWGRNSEYELHAGSPVRLYFRPRPEHPSPALMEAWKDGERWVPVRDRSRLAEAWPDLAQRFPTHQSFGSATVREILGEGSENVGYVEATELESAIFLNRNGRFERRALPQAAQMSPVVTWCVGDIDSDGVEDLFAGQNLLQTASELDRLDGGTGLWLRGLGQGQFEALSPSETGIFVEGEQRGAALADFNQDGRVDLAVSQNAGPTRLFLNQHPRQGLKIRLKGPPGNPDGVGARVTLHYPDGTSGPTRLIQGGSGTGSYDSTVQILGRRDSPAMLKVRWPDGREQTLPVELATRDLVVIY